MTELFVFKLDEVSIGLQVSAVDRVVYAVEITPLPRAPEIALGVIDVGGVMMPVVNLRQRLGLPDKDLALSDRFIITHTSLRSLVVVADAVDGVFEYAEANITDPSVLLPGVQQITGIANRANDIIFIHDLELFLSLNEAAILDSAIAACRDHADSPHAP